MFTLDLPFPPSVNNLFANRRAGGRHPSAKYKVWKTEAGWEIARQHPVPITGPVKLVYVIQDKGRCDLGNLEKATTDLLVSHKLIDGDSRKIVREINLSWSSDVVGARLTVTRFFGAISSATLPGREPMQHDPGRDQFDCGASASHPSSGRDLQRDPGEGPFHAPSSSPVQRRRGSSTLGPDTGTPQQRLTSSPRPESYPGEVNWGEGAKS